MNREEKIAKASFTRGEEVSLLIQRLPLGDTLFALNKENQCAGELLGRIPLVIAWLEYAMENDLERLSPSEILLEEDFAFLYHLDPDRPLPFMRSAYFALAEEGAGWMEYLLQGLPKNFLEEFFSRLGAANISVRQSRLRRFFLLTAEDVALFYQHLYLNYQPIVEWLRSLHQQAGRDSFIINNSSREQEGGGRSSCYAEIVKNQKDTLLLVSLKNKKREAILQK